MPRRSPPLVLNRLPAVLARRRITWGELGRRTLLPARLLARLRGAAANPRLEVAARVAEALGVRVEDLWTPSPRRAGRHR